MHAIQTIFKGYKFRSRLEARWAIFLETLKADWTYEKEGYDLSGTWYLPDFFVKDWNCWIEIKGQTPTAEEEEKCDKLAKASGKLVLLLSGEPWAENNKNLYDIILFDPNDPDRNGTSGWEFGEGRRCSEEIWLINDMTAFALKPVKHEGDHKFPLSGTWAGAIMGALSAARQARFEHGESPIGS